MSKQSGRNKRMLQLADEAVSAEFEQLKAKRERLRGMALKLGAWRNEADELHVLADGLAEKCGVSKAWIVKTLGISPREANIIWAARPKNDENERGISRRDAETIGTTAMSDGTSVFSPIADESGER